MGRVDLPSVEPGYHRNDDMEEFRASALRMVLGSLPFVTLIIIGSFAFDYYDTPIEMATLIPALLLLTVVGFNLLHRSTTLTAMLTVGGLFLALTAAVWFQPHSALIVLYALIVFLAGATLGVRGSGFVALASAGVVVIALNISPGVLGPDVALPALALIFGSAFLFWIATRPIYTALDWSWQSYAESRRIVEQLRDRQGELGRTVKSLNEAYLQLERLNDELARARRAAEEARRLKAEFAANISHELRTPLNLIIGFSEMMATAPQAYGGDHLPTAYQSDLDAILRNARHLSTLIDDVLDLSQIEAGRMGLLKEWIAVGDVVAEASDAVARLIRGKGLALEEAISEDLPLVYADRTRIRQVLINLLTNASRFTDSGTITISAIRDQGDVVLSVADTGVGIPSEDIPKVFEEFRQLDGSLRRRAGGSGLGLAVSKQFVELHGGSMWAESVVGMGSVFKFTLPAISNVVIGTSPGDYQAWDRVVASRPHEPPELRVISADPSVVRIFQRHLDGYRVVGFESVARFIQSAERLRHNRAACVVVTSSVRESWQYVQALQQDVLGVPIVACVLPTRRDIAAELGVAAYLVKPIARKQVTDVLKQIGGTLKNVLIVDDDSDMLRLVGRMVRSSLRRGHVWLAGSGEEALAITREKRPDLILLDLLMPGIDGYGVLRELRSTESLKDVPVVVITAHEQQGELLTAGLVGVTRQGGLSARELMRCVKADLDALLVTADSVAPAPEAVPVG